MHRVNVQLEQLHSEQTLLLPPEPQPAAMCGGGSLGASACCWMTLGRTSLRQVSEHPAMEPEQGIPLSVPVEEG